MTKTLSLFLSSTAIIPHRRTVFDTVQYSVLGLSTRMSGGPFGACLASQIARSCVRRYAHELMSRFSVFCD
jgi:hypothetical protein